MRTLDLSLNHYYINYERMFLNPKFIMRLQNLKTITISFPYFGSHSELRALIIFFFNINCKIVLVNKLTVGSFFNYKDKLATCVMMRASLVYKFSSVRCGWQEL